MASEAMKKYRREALDKLNDLPFGPGLRLVAIAELKTAWELADELQEELDAKTLEADARLCGLD